MFLGQRVGTPLSLAGGGGGIASAARGDPVLEEIAVVIQHHEEELQSHFKDWQSDLARMQREHSHSMLELSRRLRSHLQQRPASQQRPTSQQRPPSQQRPSSQSRPRLVAGKVASSSKHSLRPPGTPPLVTSGTAWTEPPTPSTSCNKLPEVPALVACTEVMELPLKEKRRHSVSSLDTGLDESEPAKPPGGPGGSTPRDDKSVTGPVHTTSRFGGPLSKLYGVERSGQHRSALIKDVSKIKQPASARWTADFRRMKWKRKQAEGGTPFQRFMRSGEVRAVCSTVILANAVFMGVHAQEQLQALLAGRPGVAATWEHAETGFCCFFIAELAMRLFAERWQFVSKEEAPWNLFDAFLVLLSVVDMVLTELTAASSLNFTFARTLRVFRFARILRIVRVMRFFYSFRLMVYSVIYSIVSLLWVFVMLLFVIYFFAIFFLHGVAEHFKEPDRAVDPDLLHQLERSYGTVQNALLSLFMAITGGIDWVELKEPLSQVSIYYGWVFLFYIFFMVFGVLNVVMASFVDSATQISRKDRELVTQNEMERQKQYAQNIRRFFHEADVDKTGTLSWEEFERYLQNDKVQAYFQSFELDVSQARTLFKLLDLDESNDVGIDEFVEGCMRMKGPARSIDVNMLLYESEKMIDRQVDFMCFVEEQFQAMESCVESCVENCPTSSSRALPPSPLAWPLSPSGHRRGKLRELLSQRRKGSRKATAERLDRALSSRERRSTPRPSQEVHIRSPSDLPLGFTDFEDEV